MKKTMLIIVTLYSIILLISCTTKNEKNYTVTEIDGIKIFHNKNIPSDPNFKITPKKLFTIQGYDENAKDKSRNFLHAHDIAVNSRGDIFVLDSKLSEIKKFDRNGKFLKPIGRSGSGPGEFQKAEYMLIINDTLYVFNNETKQISIFDKESNFVRNFNLERNTILAHMANVNSNSFLGMMEYWDTIENKLFYINDLHLRNLKFEKIKSLSKKIGEYQEDTNVLDYVTPFCSGNNSIYIAQISNTEYSINVYDNNGELLYQIRKNYRKIQIPENELNTFDKSRKSSAQDGIDVKYDKKFKKAINHKGIFVDKNGYLLVQVPLERNEENEFDFVVDAFKDGVFINRFKMDIGKAFDFYNSDHKRWFIGNRIYYQNREDNCVTVYEY